MINVKFKKCQFVAGVTNVKQIPNLRLNEVAFAGRSNVGKSSLLNAITFQKNLARTSKTPGRTQQINFFSIEGFVTLVDLPGYGYSKVAKSQISDWAKLIAFYISSRESLKHVFLLIDSRRGLQEKDLMVIKWLESYSISYKIVLTKIDKIKEAELNAVIESIKSTKLQCATLDITITSTKDNIGIGKLRHAISTYAK